MIISTGIRTDIVSHYSEWLFERFREGYVYTRNPLFPNRVSQYTLSPDKVDAVVFCSKNYAPALGRLHEIYDSYRTLFHYTITAYESDIEPNSPPIAERIATLRELCKQVGREKIVWRFQPIFLTEHYPQERVLDAFDRLAEQIAPLVRACIVGFLEPFFSMRTRLPDLLPLTNEKKREIADELAAIAKKYRLPIRSCGTRNVSDAIESKGCYTLDEIADANHCAFRNIRHTGNRRGCLCIPCRDIGWYDSCPSMCKYCNADHAAADVHENVKKHDPHSPLLIGRLMPDDEFTEGVQTSYLRDERQISLFDL